MEEKGDELEKFKEQTSLKRLPVDGANEAAPSGQGEAGPPAESPRAPAAPAKPESTLVERVKLTTLEKDEILAEVPFIEGTPLEVRYKADAEGAAVRMVQRKLFLAELHADPLFAGNVFKNMALTLAIKCEELCWALEEMATEASSVGWRSIA